MNRIGESAFELLTQGCSADQDSSGYGIQVNPTTPDEQITIKRPLLL
jgi:hypothetical protein